METPTGEPWIIGIFFSEAENITRDSAGRLASNDVRG
jgi:hypothetical protein